MRRVILVGIALAGATCACRRTESTTSSTLAPSASASASVLPSTTASVVLASPGKPAPPPAPDVDAIPWETGDALGAGVARKDTGNPAGESVLVAWAGWKVSLDSAERWATALYRASLEKRGVRFLFAVQGPKHPLYDDHEIGTEKLAAALVSAVSAKTGTIVAVAHSSGAFVAHELFARLANGADPLETTKARIVYFDLDGEGRGLDAAIVGRLRRAYFVGAFDATIATASHEDFKMRDAGAKWASAGGYLRLAVDGSGCERNATWCLHMTLVTTKPHDPKKAKEIDFRDFEGRGVTHAYLEEKLGDGGQAQ